MEPVVLIQVDENPNCESMDGLVFQSRTSPGPVSQVRTLRNGKEIWCDINGVDETGKPCPAMACLIDDSGDGACHLIFGGGWGLRLKTAEGEEWGEAYLLLPADGNTVR
jgi:hypothetical protein